MISIGENLIFKLLAQHKNVADAIQYLGAIQIDPVSIVSPNHHLVLAARIHSYNPQELEDALENRKIVEVYARERSFVPMTDYPLYYREMLRRREMEYAKYEAYELIILEVIKQIKINGPSSIADFSNNETTFDNLWGPKKIVTEVFELLWRWGILGVHKRRSRKKWYDLIENIIPSELLNLSRFSNEEIRLMRWKRYVKSSWLVGLHDLGAGFEKACVRDRHMLFDLLKQEGFNEISIENKIYLTPPTWQDFTSRVEGAFLLPPLDNLLWCRQRIKDVYGFAYKWEIYMPEAKRTVGPYGMILVSNGVLLGQADVRTKNGTLIVRPIISESFQDSSFDYLDSLAIATKKLAKFLDQNWILVE
jgi:uncharacterized protein YcaQ